MQISYCTKIGYKNSYSFLTSPAHIIFWSRSLYTGQLPAIIMRTLIILACLVLALAYAGEYKMKTTTIDLLCQGFPPTDICKARRAR